MDYAVWDSTTCGRSSSSTCAPTAGSPAARPRWVFDACARATRWSGTAGDRAASTSPRSRRPSTRGSPRATSSSDMQELGESQQQIEWKRRMNAIMSMQAPPLSCRRRRRRSRRAARRAASSSPPPRRSSRLRAERKAAAAAAAAAAADGAADGAAATDGAAAADGAAATSRRRRRKDRPTRRRQRPRAARALLGLLACSSSSAASRSACALASSRSRPSGRSSGRRGVDGAAEVLQQRPAAARLRGGPRTPSSPGRRHMRAPLDFALELVGRDASRRNVLGHRCRRGTRCRRSGCDRLRPGGPRA